jgi:hypothetical protein
MAQLIKISALSLLTETALAVKDSSFLGQKAS